MTDLQKITTEILPTSFLKTEEKNEIDSIESINKLLLKALGVSDDERIVFSEGLFTEKNKGSNFTKLIIDVLVFTLEQDDPKIEAPNELIIHKQNKKFIKDSLVLLLNSTKNYNFDDKKVKLLFLGKIIQSLYDTKK